MLIRKIKTEIPDKSLTRLREATLAGLHGNENYWLEGINRV
jgi:hypothetical protein